MLMAHSPLLSRKEMKMLELSGYLKGELGAEEQLSLISGCSDLREAVEGALHVQGSGDTSWPAEAHPAGRACPRGPWVKGRGRRGDREPAGTDGVHVTGNTVSPTPSYPLPPLPLPQDGVLSWGIRMLSKKKVFWTANTCLFLSNWMRDYVVVCSEI